MRGWTWLPLILLACGPKDWRQAKKIDTADAYRSIAASPLHPKRGEAAARAEVLDWEAAESAESSRAWSAYLSHHPSSSRLQEARAHRDEARWRELQREDSRTAYTAWLAMNPGSPHAAEARAAIDELAWKEAVTGADAASYGRYLVRHPQGGHVDEARARRDDLAFAAARRTDTPKAFEAYLADHPRGLHVSEARAALDGFRFSGVALRVVGQKLYREDSLTTYERELRAGLGEALVARGFSVAWLPAVDGRKGTVNPLGGLLVNTPEDHAVLVFEVSERPGRPFGGGGYETVIEATVHLVPPGRTTPMEVRQISVTTQPYVEGAGEAVLHHDAQRQLGRAVLDAGFGFERWHR